ncbi:MAG: hypothetical protein KDB27_26705 [Planctomycetales bacterium]|nr:hypothetical protein [Planctomycetales bacterium]
MNYIQATAWQRAFTAVSGFLGVFFWLLMIQVAMNAFDEDAAMEHAAFGMGGIAIGMISRYVIMPRTPLKGKSEAAVEDPKDQPTKQPWILLRAQWLVPAYWFVCIYFYYRLST